MKVTILCALVLMATLFLMIWAAVALVQEKKLFTTVPKDAMADIIPVRSVQKEIGSICTGKTIKGRRVPGFNVWSPGVLHIMETISDGRYLVNGFRNKDISETIFPRMRDMKKCSSKTSRLLKKLRQHGLIKKAPRSRRYHVTTKGRRIMGTLIELYHKDYPELIAKAS